MPHENIPCVSWREILIFQIYVLKNALILLSKTRPLEWLFSAVKLDFYRNDILTFCFDKNNS